MAKNLLLNTLGRVSLLLAIALASGCTEQPVSNTIDTGPIELEMQNTDVLLVSDHTLPGHLNVSSGGANGEERLFSDPVIGSLDSKLQNLGLGTYTLNVEDMTVDRDIQDKETFDAAYASYDRVLEAAVKNGATIVSIHFDADKIPAEDYGNDAAYASAEEDGKKYGYIGGVQLILDERATSDATLELARLIIHEDRILQQLNDVGFRIRPGYADKIRLQSNITLNIAGHSSGGAFLLEIAPQDQAVRLYETPEKIVEAIDKPLSSLAKTIYNFRQTSG